MRMDSELHALASLLARREGKSLNDLLRDFLRRAIIISDDINPTSKKKIIEYFLWQRQKKLLEAKKHFNYMQYTVINTITSLFNYTSRCLLLEFPPDMNVVEENIILCKEIVATLSPGEQEGMKPALDVLESCRNQKQLVARATHFTSFMHHMKTLERGRDEGIL